jgi:hypothetical protein
LSRISKVVRSYVLSSQLHSLSVFSAILSAVSLASLLATFSFRLSAAFGLPFFFRLSMPFGFPLPPFPPLLVFIPVSFAFPFPPVLFHLSIGYMAVSGWYVAVVRGQFYQDTRHFFWREICPWPVIGPGPKPMSFMRTKPIAVKEQNVYFNVGDHVDIGSRYHDHGRGSRDHVYRRGTDVDVDLYICCRLRFPRSKEHSHKGGEHQQSAYTFLHFYLLGQ